MPREKRARSNPRLLGIPLQSIQFWVTAFALMVAPFFFGSVDLFWISVWTILLSIGVLAGISIQMSPGQSRTLRAFLLLCSIYALVSIVQIVPQPFDFLNDPIWKRANDVLGTDVLPRISSRSDIPQLAIGHLLVFAVAFINGFFIGGSRRASAKLLKLAEFSVLAYVLYGFVALVLTPNMLLWVNKVAYQGSFTSTFVNHNTAATYVGAGAILWVSAALLVARSIRGASIRVLLLSGSSETTAASLILRSACALACIFALLQTGSRGGLICSAMGLLVAASLMVTNPWKIKPLGTVILMAAFVVIVLLLGRMDRIASQGLFDGGRWSVYGLVWEAIQKRPLLGWGNGTFADLFPALRDDSLHSWGVWDLAHSTILEIAVEMGLPVTAMILVGVVAAFVILVRAAAISKGTDRRLLAAISGIATLSFLHSLIDFSLQIPGYLIVFAVLLGCGLSRATATRPANDSKSAAV